jgi:hypothetical protein
VSSRAHDLSDKLTRSIIMGLDRNQKSAVSIISAFWHLT